MHRPPEFFLTPYSTVSSQATTLFVSTISFSPGASTLCVSTPMAPMKAMPSPFRTWRIMPWPPPVWK